MNWHLGRPNWRPWTQRRGAPPSQSPLRTGSRVDLYQDFCESSLLRNKNHSTIFFFFALDFYFYFYFIFRATLEIFRHIFLYLFLFLFYTTINFKETDRKTFLFSSLLTLLLIVRRWYRLYPPKHLFLPPHIAWLYHWIVPLLLALPSCVLSTLSLFIV